MRAAGVRGRGIVIAVAQDLAQQRVAILLVEQAEAGLQPGRRALAAQDLEAERMEGRDGEAGGPAAAREPRRRGPSSRVPPCW